AWTYVDTNDVELVVDGSCVTVGDRNRLEQLFENFYRNTVLHAPEATEIRVGPIEGGIYVEDDGPGIPAERRDEVFQPGRTTHPDGTGLGLSIVHEIVYAHGWTISVTDGGGSDERSESSTREAEPSRGARFEIVGLE
ncbi:MAG: sensor histidine kinase, partial [Halobacteriota archaeon]